jgi:hypothetical protein
MKRFSLTIDGQKFQQNVQCISPQIIEHKKRPGHMPMTIRFWLGKGTTMTRSMTYTIKHVLWGAGQLPPTYFFQLMSYILVALCCFTLFGSTGCLFSLFPFLILCDKFLIGIVIIIKI